MSSSVPSLSPIYHLMMHSSLSIGFLSAPASQLWKALVCSSVVLLCVLFARFPSVNKPSAKTYRLGRDKLPPAVSLMTLIRDIVPFGLAWDPINFILSSRLFSERGHPVRIQFFHKEIFINQGPKGIAGLLKINSLNILFLKSHMLQSVFGLSKRASRVYDADNSGELLQPSLAWQGEDRNRVAYLSRALHHRLLSGPGFAPFCKRFENSIKRRVLSLDVGCSWAVWDDFNDFFQYHLTSAICDALHGPSLVERHPDLPWKFWNFDRHFKPLFSRMPRFLARKAYASRDEVLADLKEWRAWSNANRGGAESVDHTADVRCGTHFSRESQDVFLQMDGQDADSVATQDLGFLWGSNANSIVAAFWLATDVFKHASILSEIRQEVASCIISQTDSDVDIDTTRLLRQPMLQAAYAETLRLRTHGFIVRHSGDEKLVINEWTIPRNRLVVSSSTAAHMDPSVWSSADRGGVPATQFAPQRFLKWNLQTGKTEFTMHGTQGAWIPFGAGMQVCPGRHFVKLEILLTLALLVARLDVEVLATEEEMEMSAAKFGLGVLGSRGKVRVRVRRREGSA